MAQSLEFTVADIREGDVIQFFNNIAGPFFGSMMLAVLSVTDHGEETTIMEESGWMLTRPNETPVTIHGQLTNKLKHKN